MSRRHPSPITRLAVAEGAVLAELDGCADCLAAAMGYALRAEAAPSPCPACGGAWQRPAVLARLAEAYGRR